MSKHSILVLASKTENLENSRDCFNVLSYNLYSALLPLVGDKNSNVSYVEYNNYKKFLSGECSGTYDCVVLVSYLNAIDSFDSIRKSTGYGKLVTFNEVPFDEADFSFICNKHFAVDDEKRMHIAFPFNGNLLSVTEKEPNAILVDHHWEGYLGTCRDRTKEIVGWLSSVKDKFKIYRMVRFKDEINTLSDFEIPIKYSGYLEYLENTKHIATYVITHKEGFPWGVVDMAARGSRIITPPEFIPQCMIESFGIGVFDNCDEFLSLINVPVLDCNQVKINRDNCTDFLDVARIINQKIKSLLHE